MGRNSSQTPLYEQVVKVIEGQIMSGVYKKGDLLPSEKELIESLEVSRITVRKALSILADMGIIETSKGRGSTVIFNMEDTDSHEKFAEKIDEYRESFIESTQVRLLLEPEIAKQVAIEATKEQIDYLRKCMQANKNKETDLDFHRAIVSVLNNKELSDIMNRLILAEEMNAPAGVIPPEKQDKIGKIIEGQHGRILEAIERRDTDFASEPKILEALQKRCDHPVIGYADPWDGVYKATQNWWGRRHGWKPETDWMYISSGVVTGIYFTLNLVVSDGGKVLVFTPVYDPFFAAVNYSLPEQEEICQ